MQMKKNFKRYKSGILFFAPFFILFSVFVLIPIVLALAISFTNYNMLEFPAFIGIKNYMHLIMDDDIFLTALKNTMIFAVITGPLGYIFSFLAAWLIDTLPFKRAFSLAFYIPSITSGVAMSAVWLYFFSGDRYGLINNFLINCGLITKPILWTTDPKYILGVVIIVQLWMSLGTGFLVFMAGLQNVDRSFYEAAAIDGVRSKTQELWYITLPIKDRQQSNSEKEPEVRTSVKTVTKVSYKIPGSVGIVLGAVLSALGAAAFTVMIVKSNKSGKSKRDEYCKIELKEKNQ